MPNSNKSQEDKAFYIETLCSCGLFNGVSVDAFKEIESMCQVGFRRKDAVLFAQGTDPSSVIIITDGMVRLERTDAEGLSFSPLHVELRSAGMHIGVASVVTKRPRTVTARAIDGPCEFLSIPKDDFLRLRSQHSEIMDNIVDHLFNRLDTMTSFLDVMRQRTNDVKVAYIILRRFHALPPQERGSEVRVSLADIGEALSLSENQVAKSMINLKKRGWVERKGKKSPITIANEQELIDFVREGQDVGFTLERRSRLDATLVQSQRIYPV